MGLLQTGLAWERGYYRLVWHGRGVITDWFGMGKGLLQTCLAWEEGLLQTYLLLATGFGPKLQQPTNHLRTQKRTLKKDNLVSYV